MKIPQISNELYNTLNPQNKEKLYIVENPSEYSLWSSTITYKKGDKVNYQGKVYICKNDDVNGIFDIKDWKIAPTLKLIV
jgi:hypothetical protein|nr:MAG TPA: CBD-like protein [Caudoviricetes sp.]